MALLVAAAIGGSLSAQQIATKDLLEGLTNPSRWLTYSGDYSGRRHSPLKDIDQTNVARLAAQWTFQTGLAGHKFEATPIVIDGMLYVTGPMNHAWAIDGKSGRQMWRYQRRLPPLGDLRVCCGMVNRGFAVHGERLYMTTLDAHLIALDRRTGAVLWDIELAEHTEGYASTGAPLIVNDKVIVGVAGGEFAIRGFLDAYDPHDGNRLWRFWTVPAPGESGAETWPAEVWQRGGGPTWLTGTYDPESNVLYWGTGNPNPDFYGADRKGDNLYTNALVALDADTGKLRWHFQFTPHDEHDWDANHVPVLADLMVEGQPRKVVMVANRNGFLYVLDRTNGRFLRASAFGHQTWAKEIGDDGRPVELPNERPTPEGTLTCPDLFGLTNFMSPSFDPLTGLFYVTVRETCQTYVSARPPEGYKAGDRTMGGTLRPAPERRFGALRAIDPLSGEQQWEIRHETPAWAGVLTTAAGIVFSGDNEGNFIAADSRTGRELWRYQLGAPLYAPPTTFMIEDRQYVTIAAGSTLTAFALPLL
ncbi:MAG: PQQ-dependent dehydrogenase, methanol/ethanol family [Acidobacteria bacterium]|nr:PQQ-dependent dehydrogenase, methanol/ethanol family [Acidobacteriota bacterium]